MNLEEDNLEPVRNREGSQRASVSNGLDLQNKREYLYALVLAVYRVTEKFPTEEVLRLRMREEAINILSHVEHIYSGKEQERYKNFVNSIQTLIHYCEIAQKQKWLNETNFQVMKHELFKFRNSLEMPEEIEPIKERTVQETTYEVDHVGGHEGSQRASASNVVDLSAELNRANEDGDNGASYLKPSAASALYSGFTFATAEQDFDETLPKRTESGGAAIQQKSENVLGEITSRQTSIISHVRKIKVAQVADLSSILPNISSRTIRRDLDKLIKSGKITKHGKTNGAKYRLA